MKLKTQPQPLKYTELREIKGNEYIKYELKIEVYADRCDPAKISLYLEHIKDSDSILVSSKHKGKDSDSIYLPLCHSDSDSSLKIPLIIRVINQITLPKIIKLFR